MNRIKIERRQEPDLDSAILRANSLPFIDLVGFNRRWPANLSLEAPRGNGSLERNATA